MFIIPKLQISFLKFHFVPLPNIDKQYEHNDSRQNCYKCYGRVMMTIGKRCKLETTNEKPNGKGSAFLI